MTLHKSKIVFDSEAEICVKGKMGGREVEYTGSIKELDVRVEDGIRDWNRTALWDQDKTVYSFEFVMLDGKAITAKIGKKPVNHTARVYYGNHPGWNKEHVEKCRTECGAPSGATYVLSNEHIEFSWTEEIT